MEETSAYDKMVSDNAMREREYSQRPFKNDALVTLLNALESESIDSIQEYNRDIGVYLKCADTFCDSMSIVANARLLMTMTRYKIEENYEDVTQYREWKTTLRV